jgi:MOSC domain-containing protein YiiM
MQPGDIIITSVNVGSRGQLDVGNKNAGRKQITTGIFKVPVTDPVYVTQDGLTNDFIGDLSRQNITLNRW